MPRLSREIDVLVLVEHAARELDIACALRHLARTQHGLRLEVASLVFGRDRTLRAYQPRVVAAPYFYSAKDWGTREFLAGFGGVTWVNLAFEHVLSKLNRAVKQPRERCPQAFLLAEDPVDLGQVTDIDRGHAGAGEGGRRARRLSYWRSGPASAVPRSRA